MRFAFDQRALPGSRFEEQVRYAAEAGADGIGVCWLSTAETRQFNDRVGANKMRLTGQKAGLAIQSLTLHCLSDQPFLSGTTAQQAAATKVLARGLAFAASLETDTVVLPLSGRNRIETDADLAQAASTLSAASELADRFHIRLVIRCGLNASSLQFLLGNCDHADRIGIGLDIADAAARGLATGTVIRTIGRSQLAQICVRDVVRSTGQPPDFKVRLGRGMVDFAAIRQALIAVDFDGWIVVDTPPGDSSGQIARVNLADARHLLWRGSLAASAGRDSGAAAAPQTA